MGYILLCKSGPKHECGKDLEKEKDKKLQPAPGQIFTNLKGGLSLKTPKFEHIFIAVITFHLFLLS